MSKRWGVVAKRKKKEVPNELSIRALLGQKLIDAGNSSDGWTMLYFSNGYHIRLKGEVFLVVEPSPKEKAK